MISLADWSSKRRSAQLSWSLSSPSMNTSFWRIVTKSIGLTRWPARAIALPLLSKMSFSTTIAGSKIQLRRSEEHTSELQSLMRISYAVFCLKKKNYIYIITKYILQHIKYVTHHPHYEIILS